MKTLIIVGFIIYWLPIYIYLIVWSFKIRYYVRKYKIKSLDTTSPLTYKIGRLTDFQLLGESLVYIFALFIGIFTFIFLPKKMIGKPILPDD